MNSSRNRPAPWLIGFAAGVLCGFLLLQSPAIQTTALAGAAGDSSAEILVLRYHKIKKGAFPEFARTVDAAAPYFERAGSRAVGMWQVIYPGLPGQTANEHSDYDEAYMLNRYANVAHWQATREGEIEKIAGSGPDARRAFEALAQRRRLVLESRVTVLSGGIAQSPAFFHPPLPK